jgi:hypothetical protein
LVFPRATYLNANNCKFICCEENSYNIFTSMNVDSWFGGVTFRDVFPEVRGVTFNNCQCIKVDSLQMNVYDGPVQEQFTFSGDASHATTVILEGYTFIHVRNSSWNIFPNVGVFRNERTSDHPEEFFEDFEVNIQSLDYTEITGSYLFTCHGPTMYNFSI